MLAAVAIFSTVVVLASQLMVSVAFYLRANRIDFVARQTASNVLEIAMTIPYDQLDAEFKVERHFQNLTSRQKSLQVEVSVFETTEYGKRIDVTVTHAKRNRSAKLSAWRFRADLGNDDDSK